MVVTTHRGLTPILKMGAPWEERIPIWAPKSGAYTLEEVRTQWDYELEGYFLAHCLGTKDSTEFNKAHRVFSLRDSLGFPHCTVLLHRDGVWSPYGRSADLFTENRVLIGNRWYKVLQVRGREDAIARPEYYGLVVQWFESLGGVMEFDLGEIQRYLMRRGDSDIKYHYSYLLDQSVNYFDYSHFNRGLAEKYLQLGWSL
jgi:hypothetical protein